MLITKGVWTGAAGQERCFALASDDTFIYAGLWITPAKVIKIDPATMTTVGVWTGAVGENKCSVVACQGGFVYASVAQVFPQPDKIIKINPATMTTVATWTAARLTGALISDETFLYCAVNTIPTTVEKVDPVTMATVGTWTGVMWDVVGGLAYGDGNLFICLTRGAFPGNIINLLKVDPATMLTVATWTSTQPAEKTIESFLYDAGFVYIGEGNLVEQVEKVNTATMAFAGIWLTPPAPPGVSGVITGLCTNGAYIFAGEYNFPAFFQTRVFMLDPATMTDIDTWTADAGQDYAQCITFSGDVFLGLDVDLGGSPAQVIEIGTPVLPPLLPFNKAYAMSRNGVVR